MTLQFKFRLTAKNEQTVTLERMERPGDKTTFYAPWPNATEVVDVTEDSIVFETTPPEDQGTFVWNVNPQSHQANWGATTTVASVNGTAIVLHHAPEEGITYAMSSRPGAPPEEWTVESVNQTQVHVSSPNPSPLGGETLVFDIYLLGFEQAQQRQAGMPGS